MTISNATAFWGIQAEGTPTKPNVTGPSRIGLELQRMTIAAPAAIVTYKATATTALDEVEFELSAKDFSAIAGSPTLENASDLDFEGEALPAIVDLLAILFVSPAGNPGTGPQFLATSDHFGVTQLKHSATLPAVIQFLNPGGGQNDVFQIGLKTIGMELEIVCIYA